MKQIKSITQAFSMQPITHRIIDTKSHQDNLDRNSKYIDPDDDIKEIKRGVIQLTEDEWVSFYIGYNFEGKEKFRYLEKSVNVHFV